MLAVAKLLSPRARRPRVVEGATNRRPMRLRCAMEQHAEDTTFWILAFLVVALLMVVAGVGWLLFGPPIS